MFDIHPESADDQYEVELLYDTAFAPGRTALSSYRLRNGVQPVAELCLVARDEYGSVAGAIRQWPIRVGEAGRPALLLGPVATHPTRQGEGIAGLLIRDSLRRAKELGWKRVILVGDAPYYNRFGFDRQLAIDVIMPPPTNPDRILALALVEGAMEGIGGEVHSWHYCPPGTYIPD